MSFDTCARQDIFRQFQFHVPFFSFLFTMILHSNNLFWASNDMNNTVISWNFIHHHIKEIKIDDHHLSFYYNNYHCIRCKYPSNNLAQNAFQDFMTNNPNSTSNKLDNIISKIDNVTSRIEQIYYSPEMPGYHQAKNNFESA